MRLAIIDCFCTKISGSGNRAAVIRDFNGNKDQKQQVAKGLNLPVTVFVSDENTDRPSLTYFYPDTEMALCLHGTLAAAEVLFNEDEKQHCQLITTLNPSYLEVFKDKQLLQVKVSRKICPLLKIDVSSVLRMLNLENESSMNNELPFTVSSVGSPKLLVPINSSEELLKLKPNFPLIKEWSIKNQINGIYAYTPIDNKNNNVNFMARGFNPKTGHNEDKATGVAAAALTLCLKKSLLIQQGSDPASACEIITTYVDDNSVFIGGLVSAVSKEEYLSRITNWGSG